jgi:hypothetical protein
MLLRRWERNELTDDQLLEAMLVISAGERRHREGVMVPELNRELRERKR